LKGIKTMTDNTIDAINVNPHVRKLLARHHSIAAIWCTDDVRGVRPHLTEDQAWEVLQQVDDHHDADWGINWTTLATAADDLFPEDADGSSE
jgi:hypothetical protein